MSSVLPTSGLYFIISAIDSDILAGAKDHGPESPVVVNGELKKWRIEKIPGQVGKYHISVENWHSKENKEKQVVVFKTPPGQIWFIRPEGENTYVISPNDLFPISSWTVRERQPGSPIVISVSEFPIPKQLWRFVRLD